MARRNANGEGSIYKRKDGRYEAAVTLPTNIGTRKRVRVYGKTRKEAHDKLTALLTQMKLGASIADHAWRLDEYLDHWLEVEKRRPLTRRRHEAVVRLYIKPLLGRYKLDQLSIPIVQSFINRLEADGKPIATIHQVRKVLSAALTYAVRQELLFRNVARLVELPRYRAKEAQHWNTEEITRFIDGAKTDPLYPAFLLLALYGLRRGEALGIRWRDVDFAGGVLHIRQQVQRIDGQLQQVPLKTDTSVRDEPLLMTVTSALLNRRSEQDEARDAAGDQWRGMNDESELVFTTKTGRPIESHNLARSFFRICKGQGLRRITMHGLRHSNATAQKDLQVHARDIQAILGHSDVRTTGIYEHVGMDNKRAALEKVELAVVSQKAADTGESSRQELPSNKKKLHQIGEVLSGGASQTRTGDTRLFSKDGVTLHDRITSIDRIARGRRRAWKLGAVSVNSAVNARHSAKRSWRDVHLPERPTEWSS